MVIAHVRAGMIGGNKLYMRYENTNTKTDQIRFLASRGAECTSGFKSLFSYHKKEKEEVRPNSRGGACFKCGKLGHRAADCCSQGGQRRTQVAIVTAFLVVFLFLFFNEVYKANFKARSKQNHFSFATSELKTCHRKAKEYELFLTSQPPTGSP